MKTVEWLDKIIAVTLKKIKGRLCSTFPTKPVIREQRLSTTLDVCLITLKKLSPVPIQWNTETVKSLRKEFMEWLVGIGIQKTLIY